MNTLTRNLFRLNALAAALLVAFGPAQAAEDEDMTHLTKPESSVSLGVGGVSKDNRRFGQYTGMREEGGYGLLDLSIVNRDEATGTWMKLEGRNLGLPDRELRFEQRHQANWGYFLEFSQAPRYSQYLVNTGLSGIGSANQAVSGEPARDVQLKTERKIATLGFDKMLPAKMDFQVRFRNEEKTGNRLFGRTGPDFLAEPIDSTTRGLDATLGHAGEKLQLSGGYYGSWYNNMNSALFATGGAGSAYSPIGLPPDNEAHQLHLAGGYNFTPTTRGTFKLAYARAKQNDQFIVASVPGDASLDGRVDTTQMQLGVTARPLPKLSLLANFRYDDRDDKTPNRLYSTLATGTSTFNGNYEQRDITTTAGKVEAGYQLPLGFRVLGGVEHEIKKRYVPEVPGGALASVSTREETEETTYRIQLRRSLAETVNGALSYAHSDRDGSDYLTTVLNNVIVTPGSNLVAPLHLADRKRDKWGLSADWTPNEHWSLQFVVDDIQDDYSGRTYGPRDGSAQNYSIDATYNVTEDWQTTAWVSRNEADSVQTSECPRAECGGSPTINPWTAKLANVGESLGIGLRVRPRGSLTIGADLQYTSDHGEYNITTVLALPAGVTTPPASHYRVSRLKLFADKEFRKNAGVRVDYAFERWNIDEWTWKYFAYADGTTVFQDPTQTVHFIGVSGYYRWW